MAIRDRLKTALPALALWLGVIWAVASWPGAAAAQAPEDVAGASEPWSAAAQVTDWVVASGDNRGLPFVVIDKVGARVFVHDADGELKGEAPALIGSARGDGSTPGVGDRELSDIPPEDRTTPAGRFLAAYGPATRGRTVLWVDYATAISIHRVINTNRKERRPARLKSPTPSDNRITFGCINVPVAFYDKVVRPTFKETEGVFYILPEATPLEEVFPGLRLHPGFATAQAEPPEPDSTDTVGPDSAPP